MPTEAKAPCDRCGVVRPVKDPKRPGICRDCIAADPAGVKAFRTGRVIVSRRAA
jgi:hypothetical protein